MTPPRLESCYFEMGDLPGRWTRLARVLAASAAVHCPAWHVRVEALDSRPDPALIGTQAHIRNTHKLGWWHARVMEATDGDRLLLIDADTVILRPLEDVWALDFDLAYTTKRGGLFPFNAGVIFLRVSDPVRAFMSAWLAENARLMATAQDRHLWVRRYGGVNQAALGHVLDQRPRNLQLRELPCAEWNCEDDSWPRFDPAVTRILHVKSALRRACLSVLDETPALAPMSQTWRAYETASKLCAWEEVSA